MKVILQTLVLVLFGLVGTAVYADPIVTESTSNSTVTTNGTNKTTVTSPPPSAISPSINSNNSDLCTVGISGAVQTQILELMLQASISQLKSIGAEANNKTPAPVKPAPLPIPKPAKPTAAKPKPKPKQEPSLNTRHNKLKAVKPQAPKS